MKKLNKLIVSLLVVGMMGFSFNMLVAQKTSDNRPYLKTSKAMKGIQACLKLADKKGWNMSVVIVDRGQNVLASMRMDSALPSSYLGATLKAETSLSWLMSTDKVGEFVAKNPVFNQFPGLLPIGGGEPIFSKDKQIIGAVGVAGGYVSHDQECAKAVVKAIK